MGKEMEHKPVQYARHRVREWDDSAKQGESTASHEEMLHIMPDDSEEKSIHVLCVCVCVCVCRKPESSAGNGIGVGSLLMSRSKSSHQ